ncbi:MAG: LLM class flavin-dependent oxidoreductase [Candidatus Limnocylindrales bacterium]
MDYGLVLPTMHAGASAEGIEAAAEVADRVGWSDVWTTDHVLVDRNSADEYGRIFEAILTLAHIGPRHPRLRLGTSVIVVPQRQSVVLAKELATLDVLSRGRVIAGVGVGWNRTEFASLGASDRFAVRGAYLEETVGLWRHLWGGATTPFRGRFHDLEDFVFEPLPDQGAGLPVWFGGRAEAALRRAGRIGDGYHASATAPATYAERLPVIRDAATAAGRPMPVLSARVRVIPDGPPTSPSDDYALRGSPDQIRAGIADWEAIGVTHLALYFESVEPEAIVREVEWFVREVALNR